MAASALSESDLAVFKAQGDEVFGGHAKLGQYDSSLFISCHQPDCARFFSYLSDGRVVPRNGLDATDEAKAKYTIDILNLNSPFLIVERKNWWDELDQYFQQHQQEGWSIEDLAAIDLVPLQHKLSRFFSITRQFFGPIAELVLQQYSPELV